MRRGIFGPTQPGFCHWTKNCLSHADGSMASGLQETTINLVVSLHDRLREKLTFVRPPKVLNIMKAVKRFLQNSFTIIEQDRLSLSLRKI